MMLLLLIPLLLLLRASEPIAAAFTTTMLMTASTNSSTGRRHHHHCRSTRFSTLLWFDARTKEGAYQELAMILHHDHRRHNNNNSRRRPVQRMKRQQHPSPPSSRPLILISPIILYQQPPPPMGGPPMYGRGNEYEKIWPPTNEKTMIRLVDSLVVVDTTTTNNNNNDVGRSPTRNNRLITTRRQLLSYRRPLMLLVTLMVTMGKLLQLSSTTVATATITTTWSPPFIFLPFDVLALIGLSGYLLLIHRLDVVPVPSVNDREAVVLLDQPLGGVDTTPEARWYDVWDQAIGTYLGMILPFLTLLACSVGNNDGGASDNVVVTAAVLGRPVLFFCAQRFSEYLALSLNPAVSLPLRALIPILYTTVRLLYYGYYCYNGSALLETSSAAATAATASLSPYWTPVTLVAAFLTVANFGYTAVHLLLVLPWVALRHLRVQCFLVEAESVQLRHEAGLGLTPYNPNNNNNSPPPQRR